MEEGRPPLVSSARRALLRTATRDLRASAEYELGNLDFDAEATRPRVFAAALGADRHIDCEDASGRG